MANGDALSIGGDVRAPRLVRFLARDADHSVVWSTDAHGETFVSGMPEWRALSVGTIVTVAAPA